jgi:hypothetical protein
VALIVSTTPIDAQRRGEKHGRETHHVNKRVSRSKVVYKKPTKRVVSVRTLPRKTEVIHGGTKYYYDNHRFYTLSGGRYTVILPKIGFRINILPTGYVSVIFNNRNYFWVDGIYYIKSNNEYEVVNPEVGTLVYELPHDYEKVEIDGYIYYEYANVLYEKVQVDGTRAYEVVAIIE